MLKSLYKIDYPSFKVVLSGMESSVMILMSVDIALTHATSNQFAQIMTVTINAHAKKALLVMVIDDGVVKTMTSVS